LWSFVSSKSCLRCGALTIKISRREKMAAAKKAAKKPAKKAAKKPAKKAAKKK
jgi:hypothetical protein